MDVLWAFPILLLGLGLQRSRRDEPERHEQTDNNRQRHIETGEGERVQRRAFAEFQSSSAAFTPSRASIFTVSSV